MAKATTTNKRAYLGRDAWVKHITAWQDCGLSQSAYAKKTGINPSTFCNWISKLRRVYRRLSGLDAGSVDRR